jgi:DNA repair protein RecN (Recombination protein N)
VGQLVAVHGQSEQLRLRSGLQQRELLDAFAGLDLSEYAQLYSAAQAAVQRLAQWEGQDRQAAFEADGLKRALREIDQVAPQPGEDVELPARIERLAYAEDLRQAAEDALAALSGEETGAAGVLQVARRALEVGAARDPDLAGLQERAAELVYLVSDLAAEVADYRLGLEADPEQMAALQERRATLNGLLRKYGATAAEVLQWAEQARERLSQLDLSPERRAQLVQVATETAAARDQAAAELSQLRQQAATQLSDAVTQELAGLGMAAAQFQVVVTPLEQAGPAGRDGIEFQFTSHGGALRPLAKRASGGELSRVMLALEVAALKATGQGEALTLVFDEVDQGVGGAAALAVAERLARLARTCQVLAVSHLPQIAAAADHHLVVTKKGSLATVEPVTGAARQSELARMLAGVEDSDAALKHAAELLERTWV